MTVARGLRCGGRIVQSSSRLTSSRDAHWIPHGETATHKSHGDAYLPRRVSAREDDEFNLFDLEPTRASRFVHHWVRCVAEIQKGLSLANCLIDVTLCHGSERPKRGEFMKGRAWNTDWAISIRLPSLFILLPFFLFQRGQQTILSTPITATYLIRAEVTR